MWILRKKHIFRAQCLALREEDKQSLETEYKEGEGAHGGFAQNGERVRPLP